MKITIVHHDDCPLSDKGWCAFWQEFEKVVHARNVAPIGSSVRVAAIARRVELLSKQVCTCGVVTFGYVEVHCEPEGSAQR